MCDEKFINMLIHAYRDGQRDMRERAVDVCENESDHLDDAMCIIRRLEIRDPPR